LLLNKRLADQAVPVEDVSDHDEVVVAMNKVARETNCHLVRFKPDYWVNQLVTQNYLVYENGENFG